MKSAVPKCLAVMLLLAATLAAGSAAAGPPALPATPAASPERDEADARREAATLFRQARALMEQNDYEAAVVRLLRSCALQASVGALLNLGHCERKRGRLATARDYYLQAVKLAEDIQDAKRRDFARDEVTSLESAVPTLTLRITTSANEPLEVLIDNVSHQLDALQEPIFLDAGQHVVVVRIRGRAIWQEDVDLRDGTRSTLVVPALPASAPATTARSPETSTAAPTFPRALRANDAALSGRSLAMWSLIGAGLIGVGTGLVYGALARHGFSDSNQECTRYDVCTTAGKALRDNASADATRATVLTAVGGAAILSAAVLWLTRRTPPVQFGSKLSMNIGSSALELRVRTTF